MHVFSNKTSKHYAVLEYVSIDKRTLVGNLGLAVALTVSGVYQPWLAKYLGHWKTFNWAIFSQVRSGVMMMIMMMIVNVIPDGHHRCGPLHTARVLPVADGDGPQGENGEDLEENCKNKQETSAGQFVDRSWSVVRQEESGEEQLHVPRPLPDPEDAEDQRAGHPHVDGDQLRVRHHRQE